jgi:uncharacterized coiled-coil protein SlyX
MFDLVARLRERPSRHAAETEDQAKERRQREREEAADTITTLNERNAEYIGTIDRLRRRVAETDVEIERLRAALREYLGADDQLAKVMPERVAEGVIEAAIKRVRAAKREARAALEE